jgi:V/A-type H+-transporting ATPase subunit C
MPKSSNVLSEKDWVYESTTVHARDGRLLSEADFARLETLQGEFAIVRFLVNEKGWDGAQDTELERLLSNEVNWTYAFIGELTGGMATGLETLTYLNDWHNLKAAVKLVYSGMTDDEPENVAERERCFAPSDKVTADALLKAIGSNSYAELPLDMQTPAKDAMNALAELGSGQLSDMIIDRAALLGFHNAAVATGFDVLREWADFIVDTGNIQSALRLRLANKSPEFMRETLIPAGTLSIDALTADGDGAVEAEARAKGYAGAAEALETGSFEFEEWKTKWLNNKLRRELSSIFGLTVIIAFAMLRLEDIRAVRRIAGAQG